MPDLVGTKNRTYSRPSWRRYLTMHAIADPQRELFYVNFCDEVGQHDGQRFRAPVTPYVRSGYLLQVVTSSSSGGIGDAGDDIGEQIRILRSEVRAPFRDKQREPAPLHL